MGTALNKIIMSLLVSKYKSKTSIFAKRFNNITSVAHRKCTKTFPIQKSNDANKDDRPNFNGSVNAQSQQTGKRFQNDRIFHVANVSF